MDSPTSSSFSILDETAFLAPFDDVDADLIIRSSDSLHFRVYKVLIGKVSPLLKSMIANAPQDVGDKFTGYHVLDLPLDGKTVEILLRLCYPADEPELATLDDVSHIMTVCQNYRMDSQVKKLARFLQQFVVAEPLRVFALACRAKLEDEARKAAYECLYHPMTDILKTDIKEANDLPLTAYRSLLRYYEACMQTVAAVTSGSDLTWITDSMTADSCWFTCTAAECDKTSVSVTIKKRSRDVSLTPKRWWMDFMHQTGHHQIDRPLLSKSMYIPSNISCQYCNYRSARELLEFLPRLQDEVKEAVSKVQLQFDV